MATTKQLLDSLLKAVEKVKEAKTFDTTEPFRESTIQRFEYTFELSWKLMSSILYDQGMATTGVKNIIRSAAQLALIDNPSRWFEYADARNQASHIYKEEVALAVYQTAISDFVDNVEKLLNNAKNYLP
jgi:nucleotidyltransferase substrate binding protein (TIGR01987 family)